MPCVAMRIFYADFMHRCRVAARIETEEREEIYRRYVEAQKRAEWETSGEATEKRQAYWDGLRRRMKECKITQVAVAERIGVAPRTMTFYLSMGGSEAVAARIETAIAEILRERGE